MTLPDRLDHVAASGFAFEICAEAATRIRLLEDQMQRLLDLHIAHHNHPDHGAARALLRLSQEPTR